MPEIKRDISKLRMYRPWLTPYYGREVLLDKDGADRVFDREFSPNVDKMGGDLVFFVKFNTDNGYLTSFDYQKYVDISRGCGRPYPSEMELDKYDISYFISLLEDYTVPRAEPLLDGLIANAMGCNLDGWVLEKNLKAKLVFRSMSDDRLINIQKKNIIKALECSFSYIEILSDPDFWEANSDYLDSKNSAIYIALFSKFDKANYPDLENLIYRMEYRDKQTRERYYQEQLTKAVEDNDIETVKELLQFISVNSGAPLAYAANNNNIEMVRLLLDYNAPVSSLIEYCGKYRFAVTFDVENENEQIYDLIVQKNGGQLNSVRASEEMLHTAIKTGNLFLIEKVAKNCTCDAELQSITDADILDKLSYNPKQYFTTEQILILYHAGRYEALRRVLRDCNSYAKRDNYSNKLLFREAAKNGLKEIEYIIETVFAPINTWYFLSLLEALPNDNYSQQENDELMKVFNQHREPLLDDPKSEKSSVLTYHSYTRKLIACVQKYCSDDTFNYFLEHYRDTPRLTLEIY